VLSRVDALVPDQAVQAMQSFNDVVGSRFFPQYLEPFALEHIPRVDPPPGTVGRDPDVRRASGSVVKIHGVSSCGRGIEGTGFVYARDRVMTNAHVVAGVDRPEVLYGGHDKSATVVYYNPGLDIAVLAVPGADLPYLPFDKSGAPGQVGAVLGYPQDGPLDIEAARIRGEQRLRSRDIYGNGAVVREVFSIRSNVRPGNSGGPLVSSAGKVLGVVFAASVTDHDTGYALTAGQVAASAARGITSHGVVDTGACT
jgi:S1-C subfamily serine protease